MLLDMYFDEIFTKILTMKATVTNRLGVKSLETIAAKIGTGDRLSGNNPEIFNDIRNLASKYF